MAAALTSIETTYGGIEAYLTNVAGMSVGTLERLRELHVQHGIDS